MRKDRDIDQADHFWGWVTDRAAQVDLFSCRQLEKRAGFSHGVVSKRRLNHQFSTVELAVGLGRVLRVTWVTLWTQAGFIPPSLSTVDIDPDPMMLALIEVVTQWSADQRDEVLADAQRRLTRQNRATSRPPVVRQATTTGGER